MLIFETPINQLMVAQTTSVTDSRGSFSRFFCESELKDIIGNRSITQINYSCTSKIGTLRGLHYQNPPHAEMKLVRCMKGRVWDVAVDLRQGSPTLFQWHAEELTPFNSRMMIIPEGFAHGFQVLEADSELLYLHTAPYVPGSEGGLKYSDPRLAIRWPLQIRFVSQRDEMLPFINHEFIGVLV